MSAKPRIHLDPGQRAAVDAATTAATNVIAGAGTGKTSVLVARYLKLLDDGIPVDRLLALTFTLKAAGEMRERVRRAVTERHAALAGHMADAWIMNFHQFGYRFIKENAPSLGIDPGVDVVSLAEFERIQRVLRARFENGYVQGVPSDFGGSPPPPTKLGALFDTLMRVVLHCRGIMLDTAELRAMVTPDDHPAYIARVDTIVALAREYEAELARRRLLDFSDMITIPARALRDMPALARAYRSAFDHILVDEFQDTSAAQNELLRSLSGGDFSCVTVVGDKKQSIYRWRDARVENISEFPDPAPRELAVNYRSRQEILDLAHALVANEEELRDAAVPLTAQRGAGTGSVLLFHPASGQDRHEDEAEALGAWVDHLLGRVAAPAGWELERPAEPLQAHEIAVLLRNLKSNRTLAEIERVFQRRGIPFALVGGANRAEARALESWHAWVSLLLPGDRTVDLVAALEAPPLAVAEASLFELFVERENDPGVLARLDEKHVARVNDDRDATAIRDLRDGLAGAQVAWRERGFREFLVWSLEASPLRTRLLRDGAQPAAVDELFRELLDLADGLSRRGELNLATFLDHLRAALDERKFHEDGDAVLPQGRVAVMTVHQAKGLEFPAVAVAGVVEGNKPSESFIVSRASGLYFGEKTGKPWDRHKQLAENFAREERMEDVEERCILYVALTRARDHLWVSAPSAEGKRYLKDSSRDWLFTELVVAARATGLAREIRDADGLAHVQAAPPTSQDAGGDDVEHALGEWIALRERGPQPVDTFPAGGVVTATWSDVMAFARCPLQFELNCLTEHESSDELHPVDGGDSAVPHGVEPTAFGSLVHEVLQRIADGEAVDAAIDASVARHDFGKKRDTAITTARALVGHALAAGIAGPAEGARAELPFMVRLDRVLIRGTIDRIDTTQAGSVITDYKVGARSDDHAWQVRTYAWAVQRAGVPAPITARVAYLREAGVEILDVETGDGIDETARALDNALMNDRPKP
ncbi:MAG TPA: ATP-dependent DNA helicase [Candidatus Krumholzibacteria bacterium]|nr:ATP-dependent DNA helicase [Candidatus Krumholzibacteria bacterium]